MSASDPHKPVVLVVDDEESVADTYALYLEQEYESRVAYGGEAALEAMGDDVDALLLDRRMPDLHGDDVLAAVRERGYDTPVVMTTAVDPGLNILEMDFDDYLCKPIDGDALLDTLDQHVSVDTTARSPQLSEFFSLRSKLAVLEEERPKAELEGNDQYTQLKQKVERLEEELRQTVDDFETLYELHVDIERGT